MSAQQNQRQRLQDVKDAFLVLASGTIMPRREVFQGATREAWHTRLLERLLKEELVIRHNETGNAQDTAYQAVDEKWFENLASDDVRLAEWYFKRGFIPEQSSAPAELPPEPALVLSSTEEAPPVPQPQEVVVGGGDIPQKILDTLILCAENIVYMRNRIEELHAKLDALTSAPEDSARS